MYLIETNNNNKLNNDKNYQVYNHKNVDNRELF